ncbi:hypothetical protein ACIGFK_31700 [Streptomyces sp. NPDC085524]|uniref:hypothetical protein n=1 Tax=unclassified Streptomyces TaxID=2593676 RepID=UPI0035D67F01
MSFGDPNNPYGQQPPQGQPGYGYPQQAPQGVPPQGGYAYPQQGAPQGYPAYPGGPGGYPGMPMEMPGMVKTARVLLFVVGGLQIILGLVALLGGAALSTTDSGAAGDVVGGVVIALGLFILALGVLAVVLGAKYAKGGNGVRITSIVYAALTILGGIMNFANTSANGGQGAAGGVVSLAIGGLILAAMVSAPGASWFKRPRF